MMRIKSAAGLAGSLALALAVAAPATRAADHTAKQDDTIAEGQGVITPLGPNASAVTYWVNQSDGWHVVTTVDVVIAPDSNAETHAIVRFAAVLLEGQSQLISVPCAVGERQQVLRIRRIGDRIEMVRVAGPSA